jgi:hypothetical protein
MSEHAFNFKGGEYLATMGASWFVSYSYYKFKDKIHRNWKEVSTYPGRVSTFNRTSDFHKFWLQQVLEMSDARLETNTIGLTGPQIKKMASELLR